MSSTRRPASRSDAKIASRDALIDAAVALVPTHGLDVSLDDLCARAGYTRGAFYQHFADRDALFAAVVERDGPAVLDKLVGTLELAMQGDVAALTDRLAKALGSSRYAIGSGGFMRPHQLYAACARSPLIRQQYVALVKRGLERATAMIDEAQTRGAVRRGVDAESVALVGFALFSGLRLLRELGVTFDPVRVLGLLAKLTRV
jgi:AcrR family transcriptional regulator